MKALLTLFIMVGGFGLMLIIGILLVALIEHLQNIIRFQIFSKKVKAVLNKIGFYLFVAGGTVIVSISLINLFLMIYEKL